MRGALTFDHGRRELGLAFRGLRRRPGATVATTVTLAASIGAATALFAVVNALALRPLAGVDGAGLVNVYRTAGGVHDPFAGHSHPTFLDLAARNGTLEALAAFSGRGLSLDVGGGPELVGIQFVSSTFFDVLRTRPARGRLLSTGDDRAGSEALVISHSLWERRLGAAADVLGRVVRLNDQPFTIVGVAEPGFRGHFTGFPFDAFVPLQAADRLASDIDLAARAATPVELVGRLGAGVSAEQAQADLARIATQLAREHPEALRDAGVLVQRWRGLGADLQGPVFGFVGVLLTVAALVLLVACANVAGLSIARALEQRREMALRLALGADRPALLRQLAAESLLPFAAGGGLGLLLASVTADALHAFLPAFPLPIQLDLRPDWRVALFAATLSALAGVMFGLLPAASAARVDVAAGLRLASRGVTARHPLRRVFVAAQVAFTFALLVTAGLFGRVLQEARGLETGFAALRVAAATADMRTLDRGEPAGRRFFESWLGSAREQPGVESAALVRSLPLGFGGLSARLQVDGVEAPVAEGFAAGWNAVSAGYFETLRIPLLVGRDFDRGDDAGREPVAIVSRTTAARLFPGRDAVGGVLRRGADTLRVVGVVGDAAHRRAGVTNDLFFYVPFAQSDSPRMSLVARGNAGAPLEAVRDAARRLEPNLPLLGLQPLEQHLASTLFPQRMAASLTGAFGLLGLLLAVVGLYALVASQVAEQRRELAVRLALGATQGGLRRRVLADAIRTVGPGLALGALGAALLGRLAVAFLPGVSALDAPTFAAASAMLLTATLLAADLPARRAAATEPSETLRAE